MPTVLENRWLSAINKGDPVTKGDPAHLNQLREIRSQLPHPYVIDDSGRSALNILLEKKNLPIETLIWLIGPEGQYNPFFPTFYLNPGLFYKLKNFFPANRLVDIQKQLLPVFNEFAQKYARNQSNQQYKYATTGDWLSELSTMIRQNLPFKDHPDKPPEPYVLENLNIYNRLLYRNKSHPINQLTKLIRLANTDEILAKLILRYYASPIDPVNITTFGRDIIQDQLNNLFKEYLKLLFDNLDQYQRWDLLETAIQTPNLQALELLLDRGIDPNQYSLLQSLIHLIRNATNPMAVEAVDKVFELLIQRGDLQIRPEILELAIQINQELYEKLNQISQTQTQSELSLTSAPTTEWMEICRNLDPNYKKTQLFNLAEELGLPVSRKNTKQEICALIAEDFKRFEATLSKTDSKTGDEISLNSTETSPEPKKTTIDRKCHNQGITEDDYNLLPDNQVIEFEQANFKYCFSLDEFASLLQERIPINPSNRMPLPKTAIDEYYRKIKSNPIVQYEQRAKQIHQLKTRPIGLAKIKAENDRLMAEINKVYTYFPEAKVRKMTIEQIVAFHKWIIDHNFIYPIISPEILKQIIEGWSSDEKAQIALNAILKSVDRRHYRQLGSLFDTYLRPK